MSHPTYTGKMKRIDSLADDKDAAKESEKGPQPFHEQLADETDEQTAGTGAPKKETTESPTKKSDEDVLKDPKEALEDGNSNKKIVEEMGCKAGS
jgi:hypothetical protein